LDPFGANKTVDLWGVHVVPINQSISGGSIAVANMSLLSAECGKGKYLKVPKHCWEHVDAVGIAHDFDVGDALLTSSLTYHRTVPIASPHFHRWALVARMNSENATYASTGLCTADNSSMVKGALFGSLCTPKLYPSPDPEELKAWPQFAVVGSVWSHLLGDTRRELTNCRRWFYWSFVEGWLYRTLWPEHKKCIFAKSHFTNLNQDPRDGRYR